MKANELPRTSWPRVLVYAESPGLSGQLCCDRPEAGREDIISDLRDHHVTVGTDDFEIGPPFRERPVALGDPMQSDSSDITSNRQRAFDNLIGERVVPVIQTKQALPHKAFTQRQTTYASDAVAGGLGLDNALANRRVIRRHVIEIAHDSPHFLNGCVDHV